MLHSLTYLVRSLRDRLPPGPAFVPPFVVSGALLLTWAWFAALATSPAAAGLFATAFAIALFASWLAFAYKRAASADRASDGILNQFASEVRRKGRLGIYDFQSGLYKRAYLDLRLHEEHLRCRRYGTSMALLTIKLGAVDLAAFSTDSWGSQVADLAHTVATTVRAVDITAALAPLEFAICLVHCNRQGAEQAIARLLRELKGLPAEIGLAVFPDDDCDGKDLIELARSRSEPRLLLAKTA